MEGLSGSGLHVAVECVVDAAVGADNALLKVGGKLGAVVIYESYEVEALLMILSEFENFGFEAFEGSLIELACLRGEVDIELAADGVGHEMAAVEALVRRQRMTAEATLVTGMFGGGGDAEGGDGAICVFSDHRYQRGSNRIWNSCLAHD